LDFKTGLNFYSDPFFIFSHFPTLPTATNPRRIGKTRIYTLWAKY
jgi:hypothetical protein